MNFSSTIFLFFFLPASVVGYYLIRSELKNLFLLAASLLFYAWGEPRLVLLLLGSILVNYLLALCIELRRERASGKVYVVVMLLWNFGLLFYYKYLAFALKNINAFFKVSLNIPDIALPLGISFFTFRAVSYCLDVYRGTSSAQINPVNAALYISFFPEVSMGPITRYREFELQFKSRTVNIDNLSEGVKRIIVGLAKKVILADLLGIMVDAIFSTPDAERAVLSAWLGAVGYTLQILFDFSGYSDMAIGISLLFGFHFSENFDAPYTSKSLSEFWRRWHISLGMWFRDYVYIPLGGSRADSRFRRIWNLFVVWALTGLWHGAAWNFIAWGMLNFVVIAFEKITHIPQKLKYPAGRGAYQVLTMLAVMFGWVIFRANGLKHAISYIGSMFGLIGNAGIDFMSIFWLKENLILLVIAIIGGFSLLKTILEPFSQSKYHIVATCIGNIVAIMLMLICSAFVLTGSYNPFLYSNF